MKAAALAVLLLTSAIVVWIVWTLPIEPFINRFTKDDAFYYLTIALNIAAGRGSSFDGVNPTNGFHPLWTGVLVPIFALAGDDRVRSLRIVITFQAIVCLLPSLLLVHRLASRRGGNATVALVAAVALILLPQRQLNALESALVISLGLVLASFAASRDALLPGSRPADRWTAGVLLGLLFLARTDMVFLVLAWLLVGLALHLREPARDRGLGAVVTWLVQTGLPVALLAAPYLAWNLAAFGHLMPISGTLKTSLPHLTFSPYFFGTVTRGILLVVLVGGVLSAVRLFAKSANEANARPEDAREDRRLFAIATVLALAAALHALYTLLAMNWGVYLWHFAFYCVGFLVVLAVWLGRLERSLASKPLLGRAYAAVSVLLLLLAPVQAVRKLSRNQSDDFTVASYRAALWAKAHLPPDAKFGMKDAGAFGYFCERQVTNLDGLVNDFRYQAYLDRGGLADYVRDQKLEYLAQPSMKTNWPRADSTGYESIEFFLPHTPRAGTMRLDERAEIYREPWGAPPTHFVIWRL